MEVQHSGENLGEQKVLESALFRVFLKSQILATGATSRIYWDYNKPRVLSYTEVGTYGGYMKEFFIIKLQVDILQLRYRLTSLQMVFRDFR